MATMLASGGGPHVCRELAARVEHLPEQRVQPVEEDLGDADEGERRRERDGPLVPARGEQPHEERREGGDDDGREGHEGEGQGQQAVDEDVATVVVRRRLGDLGDEHRVEDPAGQQQVELVGQRVGDVEGVAGQPGARPRRAGGWRAGSRAAARRPCPTAMAALDRARLRWLPRAALIRGPLWVRAGRAGRRRRGRRRCRARGTAGPTPHGADDTQQQDDAAPVRPVPSRPSCPWA